MKCFLPSLVFVALSVVAVSSANAADRAQPVVGLVDEVQEIYPDTKLEQPVKRLTVHAARNTLAGVHVMITGLQGTEKIRFSESGAGGQPTPGAKWGRLIDIPVLENTGLDRNTEKYSGKLNPFVIRRAPFRVYDPIEPVTSPLAATASSLALRMEIPIGAAAASGEQIHRLTLDFGDHVESLEFVVVVHRALVPPVNQASMAYINWHSIDNICSAHGVEKWSEPFWAKLALYAQLMARGRQNAFWFSWADYFTIDADGNVTDFRRDRLERYIRVFLDAGLTTIHGAPMFGRRNWTVTDMLLYVPTADGKEVEAVSAKGQRMLTQMAQRVVALMRENHWEGAWVQGVFDEPEDPFVERYRVLIALLRGVKPDIRILEATMTMNVSGLVNIWCPQVQEFQAHQDFYAQRQVAGDQVWVYTCLSPGGPWLNRLLDQERLRQVYMGWACAKFNLQGYLHWGGNFHTAKPFEELVRFHMEGQFLPAGDSHVFYPLGEIPLSSHRFEAHRIGMEDQELLAQLKRHDLPKAQAIIAQVVQGFDQYNKDVAAYRAARKSLLEAVDAFTPAPVPPGKG
jgi:hypothetical protein